MTLAGMEADVRRRLEEAPAAFWTDADIAAALQEGYAEMADATGFYERYANINLLANRTYYDLTSVLPDIFLGPRRIWNTTTNYWLKPTDTRQLDAQYRQWELVNGQPTEYFMRGNMWLGIFPRPASNAGILRFYYEAVPPALESTEEPAFPQEFHPGVVEYALTDLHMQEREPDKALGHWKQYEDIEEGLRLFADRRQSIDRITRLRG